MKDLSQVHISNYPDLPSNMYAYLRNDVMLQVTPSDGFIFQVDKKFLRRVSKETSEILACLTGKKRLKKVIDNFINETHSGDLEICKAIIMLAELIKDGLVLLDKEPKDIVPKVIGDRSIYYPIHMQVELTANCNLQCYYCYRNSDYDHKENRLNTENLIAILHSLANKGLCSIELTGGEPLLHPDFLKIINFCGEQFSLIGLLTNGTLITDSLVNDLLPIRDKIIISISLDSHISSVHDKRRGLEGAFKRTINGIRLVAEKGFITRVSMAVDQQNFEHIESTLLLARKLGATMFTYTPILPLGRGVETFKFWADQSSNIIKIDKYLREKYHNFVQLTSEASLVEAQQPGGCGAGHRTYAMSPMGLVRPCVTFDENQALFGSLATQDFLPIFGKELSKAFADIEPPNIKICNKCTFVYFCLYCNRRGFLAMRWIGEDNCYWLNQPRMLKWRNLMISIAKIERRINNNE
jgi:radical SAM protein with 4Fe4S-binding SPASM domain